jgi:hypothetical protein
VLLGLRRPVETVFRGMNWPRRPCTARRSRGQRRLRSPYKRETGDPWYDVDELEDLTRLLDEAAERPYLAPRTADFLERM